MSQAGGDEDTVVGAGATGEQEAGADAGSDEGGDAGVVAAERAAGGGDAGRGPAAAGGGQRGQPQRQLAATQDGQLLAAMPGLAPTDAAFLRRALQLRGAGGAAAPRALRTPPPDADGDAAEAGCPDLAGQSELARMMSSSGSDSGEGSSSSGSSGGSSSSGGGGGGSSTSSGQAEAQEGQAQGAAFPPGAAAAERGRKARLRRAGRGERRRYDPNVTARHQYLGGGCGHSLAVSRVV
jgi:hypothetical protein